MNVSASSGAAASAASDMAKDKSNGHIPNNRTDIAGPPPPTPPSESGGDDKPKKTEFPSSAPFGPPTEIFPVPEERQEMLEGFPDQSDELLQQLIVENRRGSPGTQEDTDYGIKAYDIRVKRWKLDGEHTHGGHSPDGTYRGERYIKPIDGIPAAYTDGTFRVDDEYEDIQTADVLKDGFSLNARERRGNVKIDTLKEKHGEKGGVLNLPKSRGRDRKEWEREIDAIMDYHFWIKHGPPPDAQ